MEARTVGHYRLFEKIGEGGMGAVYRAEDTRLGRMVALKFIRPESLGDATTRQRFLREARTIALLDHPNICTIFEIGQEGNETFLAMSYVDGPSLVSLMHAGRLPVSKAIDIATQIAEGLAEAHRKGVVHRDIKPGNVLLTNRGLVKIVDFGLAVLGGDPRVTRSGIAVGTPAYMAPEQWTGMEPDPRSDIWSLGVVLFEMLTGRLPFGGVDGRTLRYSVLEETPLPLRELRRDAPLELDALVAEMLAKEPRRRTASAEKAASLLKACGKSAAALAGRSPAEPTITTTMTAVAVPSPEVSSIAVLPFANNAADPDNEYFADGITEELITGLAKIGSLRVVSRASAFRFKNSREDPREIGRQLRVNYLLTGSVRRSGDRLRITSELVSAENGYQLWSEVYQREARDVFAIQEDLAEAILSTLKIQLSSENPLAEQTGERPSLQAYQLYLKGLFYWNKRTAPDMNRAIEFFQEAINTSPLYLKPYSGLSDALMLSTLLGWEQPRRAMPRAKAAALTALQHHPKQAEAHISLAMIQYLYDWNPEAAAASFQTGLRLAPHYAIGKAFHAHFLLWTGEFSKAMREIDEALDLDPLSLNIMSNRGWFLIYQRRYAEAADTLNHSLYMDPDYVRSNLYLGAALAGLGKFEEALAATRKAMASSSKDPILSYWLARILAEAGHKDEARMLLAEIEPETRGAVASPLDLAIPYGALGDYESASELMERAIEERWPLPPFLRDPRIDCLRRYPRFTRALRQADLPIL